MTAIVTTTRFWESEDSAESINNQFLVAGSGPQTTNSISGKELKSNSTRGDKNYPKKSDKKSSRTLSRTSILAVPKRRINDDTVSGVELNRVKKSALLYEITERTNELARPKTIITDSGAKDKQKASSRNSLPKIISDRISELSRPKSFYNPPTRPPGYIAPSALRAVATQRIIELATPQKKRSVRSPIRKNLSAVLSAPCSSRISYLARPKHSANCSRAQKNFLKRSLPTDNYPPPWEFPSTRVWKELGYSENVVKKCEKEYKSSVVKRKSRRTPRLLVPSKSNDSVFSLSEDKNCVESPATKRKKKFHSKTKARRRQKFSKSLFINA